jgi:hypothetical protein
MADEPYRLDQSALVIEGFRQLVAQARAEGRIQIFLQAARWIVEELTRTPSEFGESREYLAAADIRMRCGCARPLYVEYGVNEPNRVVTFRRFKLLKEPKQQTGP